MAQFTAKRATYIVKHINIPSLFFIAEITIFFNLFLASPSMYRQNRPELDKR